MQMEPEIKYYSRPHLGAPAARNFGLKQAKGEYIAFFDSDDLWPADYIEKMIQALQSKPGFDAAYSKIVLLLDGVIRGQYTSAVKPACGYLTAGLFSGKPFILPSSVIFKRAIWAGVYWDEVLTNSQDFDVFLRLSTRTKFLYVPDVSAIHRKSKDSIRAAERRDLINYNTRVMERFYFRLGGDAYVPRKTAFRSISHRYRRAGLDHYLRGDRKASIDCFSKALIYHPLDLRLYLNLAKAFLLSRRNDKIPDWRPPAALDVEISKGS